MPDAGRVIAGSARGIRLEAPGQGTRPLADRVKQTLFAILEPDLPGARFLDLFAGSGAAGIEALSRGAASATFVEHDAGAAAVIAANLARTHLAGPAATVVRDEGLRWLRRRAAQTPGEEPFHLVVLDPPYAKSELLATALELLGAPGAGVAPGGRVVATHFWRDAPPAQVGLLASERERRFGESALTFYRRQEDR
jgi:16S rRNA (guanine(966)-N(2))-methyltransferase RsmD